MHAVFLTTIKALKRLGPSKDDSPRRGFPLGDLNALRAQGDDPDSWTVVIMSSDLARQIHPPSYGLQDALHRPRVTDGRTLGIAANDSLPISFDTSVVRPRP